MRGKQQAARWGLGGMWAFVAGVFSASASGASDVTETIVPSSHYVSIGGAYTHPDSSRGVDSGNEISGAYAGRFMETRWWEARLSMTVFNTSSTDFYQKSLGLDLLQPFGVEGHSQFFVLGGLGAARNDVSPKSDSGWSAYLNAGAGWRGPLWESFGMRPRLELRYIYDSFNSGKSDIQFGITLEIPSNTQRIFERIVEKEKIKTVEVPVEVEKVVEKQNVCVVPVAQGTPPAPPAVGPTRAEIDTDGDGVMDAADKCGDTLKGAKVGADGCAVDDQVLILAGIDFEPASAKLRPSSNASLDAVVAFLKTQANVTAEVLGHTDAKGRAKVNERLSADRAKAVVDYLSAKGISAERLSWKGIGAAQPIASNDTEEGRAKNRRVELHLRAAK